MDRNHNAYGSIKRGGGLCAYVRSSMVCTELPGYSCMNGDIEISITKYNLPCTRDIFVFNIIVHQLEILMFFLKHVQTCLSAIRNDRNCDILIGGDINV